ncbi:zonular occludens toxin domain-containing protein [Methanolobus sp. ZRKC5]|uniref:zonular occludens toxin domain-containing protein n=1 Tax=unclassified Methanolobus TaxID=2629569 RepID=UPI00313BFE3D
MSSSIDAVAGMIRHRINEQDKNFMCVMVGETGSGKSADAVELARRIDPSFEDNPRIVFTPKDFLEYIPKMKKGQAIIFDEAGVGIPAREWQRIQNKLIGYVTQLFRHLNLCVIFTVPSMSFIDKQVKTLLHAVIETKTIDFKNKLGVAKYWRINHNPVFDFTKLEPLILFSGGNHTTIDPLYIPHPPHEVWNKYVAMKEAYANKFYQNAFKEVSGEKDLVDGNRIRLLTNKSNAFDKALPILKEDRTWKEVAELLGYSERTLQNWTKTNTATAAIV